MKERPILFSGPMVRALLAGTKTQTRRICKPAANLSAVVEVPDPAERGQVYNGSHFGDEDGEVLFACPYGGRGDRLWVREAWSTHACFDHLPPRDCPKSIHYMADGKTKTGKGRPSIHMPRWASRLTLDLISVRVERLQDISESDALAEGIVRQPDGGYGLADTTHYHATDPRICYWSLWDHINGAGSVESNPFVWALGFPSTTTPAQP